MKAPKDQLDRADPDLVAVGDRHSLLDSPVPQESFVLAPEVVEHGLLASDVDPGVAIPHDDRFGYFSLPAFTGDETFPKVVVKMVDGRPLPGNFFWLFYTGLTGLHYTLTVTDTVTGVVQTYGNDQGGAGVFCGGADTETFR